jgi:hypothetical protein
MHTGWQYSHIDGLFALCNEEDAAPEIPAWEHFPSGGIRIIINQRVCGC